MYLKDFALYPELENEKKICLEIVNNRKREQKASRLNELLLRHFSRILMSDL